MLARFFLAVVPGAVAPRSRTRVEVESTQP